MSRNSFLDQENIDLLWEVITSEQSLTGRSPEVISELFNANLRGFFESADNKSNTLIDLNKKYILLIISYVQKHIPLVKKIKIHDSDDTSLVTRTDIQNNKRSSFDKKYKQMQDDFTDSMTLKVPPAPVFKDDMELAIKQITEQRKYDIENISTKFIKIHEDDEPIADVKKQIRWLDETPVSVDIFSKLKKNDMDPVKGLYDRIETLDNKVNQLTNLVRNLLEERKTSSEV
jgi:hypothetical protein